MERATLRKISVRRGDKAGTGCEDPYRPKLKGAADPTKILQEADNDGPTGFPSEHAYNATQSGPNRRRKAANCLGFVNCLQDKTVEQEDDYGLQSTGRKSGKVWPAGMRYSAGTGACLRLEGAQIDIKRAVRLVPGHWGGCRRAAAIGQLGRANWQSWVNSNPMAPRTYSTLGTVGLNTPRVPTWRLHDTGSANQPRDLPRGWIENKLKL